MSETIQNTPLREAKRKRQLLGLGGLVVLLAAGAGGYWYFHASHFVSTDNAYAAVEIAQVTPSVGGTISEVLVTDTQAVKQGDVLVRIDQTDARLALAQAEADLGRATRRVKGFVANDGSLAAQIAAREADEQRAAVADILIDNSGDESALADQVDRAWVAILAADGADESSR